VVGQRTFIEPFVTEDANPKNEFVIARPEWTGAGNAHALSHGFGLEKKLADRLSITLDSEWDRILPGGSEESSESGFNDLGITLKYAFFLNPDHETIVSFAVESTAPTGTEDVEAEPDWAFKLAWAAMVDAPRGRGRSAIGCAAILLGAVLILEISLNAVRMSQISGICGAALIADVFEMRWSLWWAPRMLALAAIGVGLTSALPRWKPLAAIGAVSLLARSLQGHAGAHGANAALVDWIHLVMASVWMGGLLQLLLSPAVSPRVASRASKLFATAMGPLVLAGAYGAVLHVQTTTRLVGSPHGRVLIGIMILAALGIALGAQNHYRNVPALERGEPEAERRLLRAVRVEALLALVLLLLSAALGVLPMPHAM
jgi:putative copper resistance protein D